MELNLKQKIIIAIIAFLLIIGIGIYFFIQKNQQSQYEINDFFSDDIINNEDETNNTIIEKELNEQTIIVHITGQVKNAGIYELPENARIADAIKAAGGETKNANLNKVNLAFILSDGQKIYIPSKNENEVNEYITSESGDNVIVEDNIKGGKSKKVNINNATQEQLEELPGIGPSIAKKIIEYKNQIGKFTSVEQLMEVSGIGEAKYEKIKDYVAVK